MKILKYELDWNGAWEITLPVGAKPLSVQMQHGAPMFWCLVDPEAPLTRRKFYIIGTGHPAEHIAHWEYLGTIQDDSLVWHFWLQPE